ncbi:hypothetical protein HanIR_Chr04g0170241 [Helianthus annuus]|nr:hypothetical protein HanIR_Chr04g0170241 [Helianthus annuus]
MEQAFNPDIPPPTVRLRPPSPTAHLWPPPPTAHLRSMEEDDFIMKTHEFVTNQVQKNSIEQVFLQPDL